ncbi:MAG TPA: flagellar basal body L-ring protein FlgH [Patescibacteria group bacterium]|nr:flagellar basal body L-ring protein FlgH [Patescibacteria group bacterium]
MNKSRKIRKAALLLLVSCALSGCGAGERIANIGKPPPFTPIENPQLKAGYKPISMPMPQPKIAMVAPNSLWDANRQTFFKDQRAADVGDILTVLISIDDKAKLNDETKRSRNQGETLGIPSFFGIETQLQKVLPQAVDPSSLVSGASTSDHDGKGSVDRKEQINVKLAAVVTQVLPNGNFVIHGQQETLVNFENRTIGIDGIIRPQDISTNNTINYDQVAEARITYGGKGQLMDVQQPRYGQQLYDIISPM